MSSDARDNTPHQPPEPGPPPASPPDQRTQSTRASRRTRTARTLLGVAALGLLGAVAAKEWRAFTSSGSGWLASVVSTNARSAPDRMDRMMVKDVAGRTVPAVEAGEPAIVMINSTTCGYCRQTLRDLSGYARGRAAPRLRVITLEGADAGLRMLEAAGVSGAVALGPAVSASQLERTLRNPGTPTFLAIDGRGRVQETMPGYPGGERLATWFDVMLATRDLP